MTERIIKVVCPFCGHEMELEDLEAWSFLILKRTTCKQCIRKIPYEAKTMAVEEVTWIDDTICVCDNCGAFADSPENIKHHRTCTPGESKKWEKFYNCSNNEIEE